MQVSEQYTQERSCSYRGLKAAAAYTLRIMPYRVVNGGRVYAASAGEIKRINRISGYFYTRHPARLCGFQHGNIFCVRMLAETAGSSPQSLLRLCGRPGHPVLILMSWTVYQVRYRVERQGYQPFGGIAEVEITKAVPVYTAPVGLRGTSGKTLASVALPKGFAWQANSAVKLSEEGVHSWKATYTPEDVLNYETVSTPSITGRLVSIICL